MKPKKNPLTEPLTRREQEILDCLEAGMSIKEIASKMNRSINTINFPRKNLFDKLGVHSSTGAVPRAKELRIIR